LFTLTGLKGLRLLVFRYEQPWKESVLNASLGYSELVVKMGVKFSFFAYGILAICALALILAFASSQIGLENWAGNFFYLAVLIVVLFIFYMFVKLLRR